MEQFERFVLLVGSDNIIQPNEALAQVVLQPITDHDGDVCSKHGLQSGLRFWEALCRKFSGATLKQQ